MLPVSFSMSLSLDGYISDEDGDFQWPGLTPELFRFHVEEVGNVVTYVCGRKLFGDMSVWETSKPADFENEAQQEFARIWQALPKVVFSRTLTSVEGNARLATDDLATELGRLCDQPGEGVVSIGGASLAAAAMEEDLVDEFRMFVFPIVVGGGTPYFPSLAQKRDLRLVTTRTFESGVVYLRYERVRG